MNQDLITKLFNYLNAPELSASTDILKGLLIKAACLRHLALDDKLHNTTERLTEDEASELSYLQEWFDQNHFDYLFDNDDQLHMRNMISIEYAMPEPEDNKGTIQLTIGAA